MTFFGGTIACAHCIVNVLCTKKQKIKENQTKQNQKPIISVLVW